MNVNKITQLQNQQYFCANKKVTRPEVFEKPQIDKLPSLNQINQNYAVNTPQTYTLIETLKMENGTPIYLYKLASGQKVAIIPKEGPTIVRTSINSGSMNEPDNKRGISHFIEHMFFNGTDGSMGLKQLNTGEFFSEVEKMGGDTNASTGLAQTTYFIKSNQLNEGDLENKIKLHAAMMFSPAFENNLIVKERGPVNAEINMCLDSPENILFNTTFKTLYNIESTSKDLIAGSVENINSITRDDILDYFKKNYYPANMTTVITGDVDPEKTIKLVSQNFKSTNPNPPQRLYQEFKPINSTTRKDLTSSRVNADTFMLAFNGPKNKDFREYLGTMIVNNLLCNLGYSRINSALEEDRGRVDASIEEISTQSNESKMVVLAGNCPVGASQTVLNKIYAEIYKLQTQPLSTQDLEAAKIALKKQIGIMMENSIQMSQIMAYLIGHNQHNNVENINQIIDSLSVNEIQEISKKYFDLEKTAITVIHPQQKNSITFTGAHNEKKYVINPEKVKEYTLPNRIKLIHHETNAENAIIDMQIKTPAPAKIKTGTDLILTEILNSGTNMYSKKIWNNSLDKNGITQQFKAYAGSLEVSNLCLNEKSDVALQAMNSVLTNPSFTEETFKQAKETVRALLESLPPNVSETYQKAQYPNQHYGDNKEDHLKSLDSITLGDVIGLYTYLMNNSKATVSMCADQKTANFAFQSFSRLKNFATNTPYLFNGYVPTPQTTVVTTEIDKTQSDIIMGYKFLNSGNLKDSVTLNLLNIILGGNASSRLFMDLRESQKLAYSVHSNYSTTDNNGELTLSISTTTDEPNAQMKTYDNIQKSIDGFKSHVSKLQNEYVSDEELVKAKLFLKNTLLNKNEMGIQKTNTLIKSANSFYGIFNLNQAFDMIDSITKDDLKNCANYVFSHKPVIAVTGTKTALEANAHYLESLKNI